MKDALGGAAVAFGIMEDALLNTVGINDVRAEVILACGEREGTRHAVAVEDEREGRQVWDFREVEIREILYEETLNALVTGREIVGEES